MKKICSFSGQFLTYDVPYTRQANVYESEEPMFKGCLFEVSSHLGAPGAEWEFKPFKTVNDAIAYALTFMAPASVVCNAKKS